MLDYIQREGFTEIIISTPGPIGLTALAAAKMLNLQTSGIYHTDIPEYVRILTEDSFLETLTWTYMKWFYDQLGSGNSDQPDEPSLWDLDRFVDEVEQVRQALGLDRSNFVLYGQSWGGLLAIETDVIAIAPDELRRHTALIAEEFGEDELLTAAGQEVLAEQLRSMQQIVRVARQRTATA